MKSTVFKVSGILVSLGSAICGGYWVLAFVRSTSPDKGLFLAPLFFCGLPLTFIGNLLGFGFLIAGKEFWYYALLITCYFVQWQFVARWLYRKGVYA